MEDNSGEVHGYLFGNTDHEENRAIKEEMGNESKRYDTSDINAQPQDFVVVRGHTYRVSRAQLTDNIADILSPNRPQSPMTTFPKSPSSPSLRQALQDANEIIERQRREIALLSTKVEHLEYQLGVSNSVDKGKIGKRPTSRVHFAATDEEPPASPGGDSSHAPTDAKSSNTRTRRPSRALVSSDDTSGSSAISPSAASRASANLSSRTSLASPSPEVNSRTRSGSGPSTGRSTTPNQHDGPASMSTPSSTVPNERGKLTVDTREVPASQQRLLARIHTHANERRRASQSQHGTVGAPVLANSSGSRTPSKQKSLPSIVSGGSLASSTSSIIPPDLASPIAARPGVGSGQQPLFHSASGVSMSTPSGGGPADLNEAGGDRGSPVDLLADVLEGLSVIEVVERGDSTVEDEDGETGDDDFEDPVDAGKGRGGASDDVATDVESASTNNNNNNVRDQKKQNLFTWKGEPLTLFIVNDNPQLITEVRKRSVFNSTMKENLINTIIFEDTEHVSNNVPYSPRELPLSARGGEGEAYRLGLEIMLEAKGDDGMVYFLLGRVVFSGGIEGVEGADPHNPRGAHCVAVRELRGYRIDIKKYAKKNIGNDIFGLELGDSLPETCKIKLESKSQLEDMFLPCTSRVEVIFSPSHHDCWYPYWEGDRKMAPQFRSQGVGYIRLGDDMSRFGIIFLSADGGQTFFEPEGGSEVPGYASSLSSITSASTGITRASIDFSSFKGMPNALANTGGTVEYNGAPREGAVLKSLLQQLKDEQVKWSHRAQLLQQLQSCASSDPALLPEILSELLSNITKQKNPHVVRAAAICVASVGDAVTGHGGCGSAWKSLLLETIHLLRHANKNVSDGAKESLAVMHGRSISLSSLTPLLEEILSGPRGRVEGTAFNTVRVVQWLVDMSEKELGLPSSGGTSFETAGDGLARAFPRVDAASVLIRCRPLLLHREEATRDVATALMARLLALDVVQSVQLSPHNTNQASNEAGISGLRSILSEQQAALVDVDVACDLVRRLVSPITKQALEALHVPTISTSSTSGSNTPQTPSNTQDVTMQRRLIKLHLECLRLVCARESLSLPALDSLMNSLKPGKLDRSALSSQALPSRLLSRKGSSMRSTDSETINSVFSTEVLVSGSALNSPAASRKSSFIVQHSPLTRR